VRYRLMASYKGVSYLAAVGPSDKDITLFAAPPPPESLGFSPYPRSGVWKKDLRLEDIDALWESRPTGCYHDEPCLVLDDLGDRLHIFYLGTDAERANSLGYWQIARGVFEVVVPRNEVTELVEERREFSLSVMRAELSSSSFVNDPSDPLYSAAPRSPAAAIDVRQQDSSSNIPKVADIDVSQRLDSPQASTAIARASHEKAVTSEFEADIPAIFDLTIRPGRSVGKFDVEVLTSDAGEARSTVKIDLDDLLAQRDQLQLAILASAASSRRILPETEKTVQKIGQQLFNALLGTGDVAGQYRAAVALASKQENRLRIALRIDAPKIAALPWEAMYDNTAAAYVCRRDQLIRHVRVPTSLAPLRIRSPLRILGVVSSPRGLLSLDVEKEQGNLTRALSRPIDQGRVEIQWSPAATWDELHSMLLDGPWHVVHYIGHGDFDSAQDEGFLALTDDNGRAHHVAAHRLVDLLRQANPMPRLVVLNSCSGAQASTDDLFSSIAAALVRGGVGAVAAMQFAITDRAAVSFARGFYSAIAHGRNIDDAVTSGRISIVGTSDFTLEWITPVLYLRGQDARLFSFHKA
jgi:hypothetical protein